MAPASPTASPNTNAHLAMTSFSDTLYFNNGSWVSG
jgi:hypothetical protein